MLDFRFSINFLVGLFVVVFFSVFGFLFLKEVVLFLPGDWLNHFNLFSHRGALFFLGYPVFVYFLFPFFPFGVLLHVCLLLPLLLFFYGESVEEGLGFGVFLSWFLLFEPLFLVGQGFLKEIVELELLILFVLFFRSSFLFRLLGFCFGLFVVCFLLPFGRLLSALVFSGTFLVNGVPSSSVVGLFLFPFGLLVLFFEKEWFLFFLVLFFGVFGLFESRLFSGVLVLVLPFVFKFFKRFLLFLS